MEDGEQLKPPPDQKTLMAVSEDVIQEAQSLIAGCQSCNERAEIPFDYLLDALTGSDPTTTDYLISRTVQCPRCASTITEKTNIIVGNPE
jgi:hypothetical protein